MQALDQDGVVYVLVPVFHVFVGELFWGLWGDRLELFLCVQCVELGTFEEGSLFRLVGGLHDPCIASQGR